jgi:peptidoglycan/xylan/chitin deacetylase (PgdA/CDA1 family)
MRGFRSRVVVALVGAGLLAGCAQPGTTPMPGSRWAAGGAASSTPRGRPTPTQPTPTKSKTKSAEPAKPAKPANAAKRQPTRPSAAPHFDGPAGSRMRTGSSGVALTFDDGPDPVQTPKMLDLLARYHVTATFCLIGRNAAAHPELVRRIVVEGHTLCNHTWRHSLTLGAQSPATIRADLLRTNDAIHRAAPNAKIKYLRAPGGNFTPAFVRVAAELGMTSIYWQVDPRDWDHPKGETSAAHQARIVATVQRRVHQGSIVLSHDCGQPDTIEAYRILLPWLKNRYWLSRTAG